MSKDNKHQMMPMDEDHHLMMIADFKKLFYIVLALTIMILSGMIQQ